MKLKIVSLVIYSILFVFQMCIIWIYSKISKKVYGHAKETCKMNRRIGEIQKDIKQHQVEEWGCDKDESNNSITHDNDRVLMYDLYHERDRII